MGVGALEVKSDRLWGFLQHDCSRGPWSGLPPFLSWLVGQFFFVWKCTFTIILPSVAAKNCRDDNVYRPSESREACTGGSKYEMIIELHINERKIQLSENNGDAIRFYSVTLWLCWYIPAKPLGAFKFSFETNWLKAFGRFAICKLKSLILYHPHHDEDADDVDDDSYDDIDNAFWQIQSVFFCKRLPSHWSRAGLH